MTERDIIQIVEAHKTRDAALLSDLKARGVDFDIPRSVELNFWAPDQRAAALLAKALYDRGHLLLVLAPANKPESERQWNIEAGANLTVEKVASSDFTRALVELANQYAAEYDGWGTQV